jgi:hypothetical protein
MTRLGEEFLGCREFDNGSQVHDRDSLADVPHHRQIMGDDQDRQTQIALQLAKQIEDLDLN